jgi:hypothetical protein
MVKYRIYSYLEPLRGVSKLKDRMPDRMPEDMPELMPEDIR